MNASDDWPAFPHTVTTLSGNTKTEPGISFMDYMAGQALIGLLSHTSISDPDVQCDKLAETAYSMANAMKRHRPA